MTRGRATTACLAGALILSLASMAHAETLYAFAGHCQRLMLEDRDVSDRCEDVAWSARFPEGRIGYIFIMDDRTHVAFSWHGDRPDDVAGVAASTTTVDRVSFLVRGDVEQIDATGVCALAKDGAAPTIACEAKTPRGAFAARFQVGIEPPKKLFGAPEPPKP
jgi:hypothetical protein